jgi:isopenicillin-N epimerase
MNDASSPVLSAIRPDAWLLDADVAFLNHGSFGACPRPVLERQQELRALMEREPVEFLVRKLAPLLDESRRRLAELIGAQAADLVFVHNATGGVNSVLRSLKFEPGDEILVSSHDYNACRNVACYAAQRSKATVVEAPLPLPIASPGQVTEAVLRCVTARTRLALLDHITSPTALKFPIEELVRELDRRGIDTLVDGAHAPGMVPLDLERLQAAYYAGNCHKWLCAPKGAGFLYVRRDRQAAIQPPTISHGFNRPREGYSSLQDAFDWPGTLDPTPWLCVGEAIGFLASLLDGGLPALMRRNHELAVLGRRVLCQRLGLRPIGPEAMLGSMAAFQLPDDESVPQGQKWLDGDSRLHDELLFRHGIEVPTFYWPAPPQRIVRISAQAYNHPAQYQRLAEALQHTERIDGHS